MANAWSNAGHDIVLGSRDPGSKTDSPKAVVRGLLADLGWTGDSVVDLGGIATARRVEHYHLLMLELIGAARNPMVNIAAVS